MTVDLQEIKNYLRISHDLDDSFLTSLEMFSSSFIEEQTGVTYNEGDEVYKMAIMQVISHFYDKRESVSDKSSVIVPFTMDCLIKHIGIRGPVNE